jgi:DNA primase
MREWFASALLVSSDTLPEQAEGYMLGRGLPHALATEMRVGLWRSSDEGCPDSTFAARYGGRGHRVEGWLSIPMWSPRGQILGVEYRRWDGEKGSQKFYMPESKWLPVFTGLVPSALNRIWRGADVWLVEGVFDLAVAHAIPSKDVALACGGAKITPNQLAFLRRFLSDRAWVHVCFDMDETGRNMAHGYTHPDTGKRVWGVVERLTRAGIKARVVEYRGGKDPGEIWEAEGTEYLRRALSL